MGGDPLERLVVDEQTIAREELAEVLAPYVGITKSGGLVLTEDAATLNAATRMLAVMLALWAAEWLGLRASNGASPNELTELSGLPSGTVRPKLSELSKRRLVAKRGTGYEIPLASVRLAAAVVSGAANTRRKAG
ncbi:MAG: hypothetical protein JWO37_282 [Acidimicrobiales bacterium]|jgi:hypothetical protein|nr:hypothetical protein [Acidimicrobiales bacterium]